MMKEKNKELERKVLKLVFLVDEVTARVLEITDQTTVVESAVKQTKEELVKLKDEKE